jgi:hypothetical protein
MNGLQIYPLHVVFVLLLFMVSCKPIVKRPEIDVCIENRSSNDIRDTRARFGEYACSWGSVGKTFKAVYGLFPHPITADTEIHWSVNGVYKSQKFDLRRIYLIGASGRLDFIIYDDHAEIAFH